MKQPDLTDGKVQISECIAGIIRLLNYYRSSGIVSYPRNDGVDRFLNVVERDRRHGSGYHSSKDASATVTPRNSAVAPTIEILTDDKVYRESLQAFLEEVAVCQACSLHQQRTGCTPGSGSFAGVRLMLVGDWLRWPKGMSLKDNTQFGIEEDQMVDRMLEAIHLEKDKVFITNVIKCAIPDACLPASEHIRICMSYLQRQIAVIEPEIICGMGLAAARALLGGSQPLSRLRGSLQSFTAETGKQIPVLVTYHPTFLLQNPTMKKAAWDDLQRIGQYLKTF